MARVLVPLAQGCEELEAVTIIDLLVRAGIEVVSAGLEPGPVHCSRGVIILPDTTLDEALRHDFDMIVLPGGLPGADHLDADPRIHSLLKDMAAQGKYTAAICAAPKVLASCGLLTGRRATAYPGTLEKLDLPDTTKEPAAVVIDGQVITSRGPGTAMDFALALIETLLGRDKRNDVEIALQRP
ncbi:MAG TPA: DJ-1/PfpI family protein [Chromatiales bacterium]|nr:DJ-1/PfpI family protein [Chromatiales bacterium]HEX22760.1 DJ-1/PfpI family protein [Chromatiales bacterium]